MIGTKESWTDKNSLRDYPLVVNSGNFPSGAIVDVFVSICSNTEVDPCVTILNVGPNLISVVFSDSISGVDLFAAIGEAGVENIALVTPASGVDVSGYVKFGRMIPTVKTHTRYETGAISLLKHCFVNFGNHVVESATTQGLGEKIQGDLSFVQLGDFMISPSVVESDIVGDETMLEISLNNPSRYKELCSTPLTVCECEVRPIKQLNTVLPDTTDRNITIESSLEILQVLSTSLGITISSLATSTQLCPPTNLPISGGTMRGEKIKSLPVDFFDCTIT